MNQFYEDIPYKIVEDSSNKDAKKKYWDVAIGLQKVDGLSPTKYLLELAEQNIEGSISNEEIEQLLYARYGEENIIQKEERIKERDMVTNRMVELLKGYTVSLRPSSLKNIHKYLFKDILPYAGEYRPYNITKNESILNGNTVLYADYRELEETLAYDFDIEKHQNYASMDISMTIKRVSEFTSSIWQVHPFAEGNTRTTAVFIQAYLSGIGFQVNNELFEEKSIYFRNALVRANYSNYPRKISSTLLYLEMFYENLLTGKNNELSTKKLILQQCFEDKEDNLTK